MTGLPAAGLALGELAQPGFVLALAASPLTAAMVALALALQAVALALRAADRADRRALVSIAVLLAAAAGACAAAAIVEWLVVPRRRAPRAARAAAPRARRSRSAAMTVLLARLARRAGVRAAPGDLEARIAAAGAPLGLAVGDVIALKGAAALGLALVALPFAGRAARAGSASRHSSPRRRPASSLPELVLARRARARGRRIAGELADVLDLLRVAVGAGLPVGRALGEVGRRMSGVLAAELDGAAARMQLGRRAQRGARASSSRAARRPASRRSPPRSSAPTGTARRWRRRSHALAAEARAEQARGLRDAAARAAPKIQLVVALVLVPAVMLLIGAVLVRGMRCAQRRSIAPRGPGAPHDHPPPQHIDRRNPSQTAGSRPSRACNLRCAFRSSRGSAGPPRKSLLRGQFLARWTTVVSPGGRKYAK